MSAICATDLPDAAALSSPEREQLDLAARVSGDIDALEDFARELGGTEPRAGATAATRLLPRRVETEHTIERDLAKLVLAVIDLVRQLMERQALRRVSAGSLTDDQVDRMGETFLRLDRKIAELRTAFGLDGEDLSLSLGPIRNLSQGA